MVVDVVNFCIGFLYGVNFEVVDVFWKVGMDFFVVVFMFWDKIELSKVLL